MTFVLKYVLHIIQVKHILCDCHAKKAFQAMTCHLCGSFFKTKCDKRKHINREHEFCSVLIKGYLNSGTFFFILELGW